MIITEIRGFGTPSLSCCFRFRFFRHFVTTKPSPSLLLKTVSPSEVGRAICFCGPTLHLRRPVAAPFFLFFQFDDVVDLLDHILKPGPLITIFLKAYCSPLRPQGPHMKPNRKTRKPRDFSFFFFLLLMHSPLFKMV